jgi:hypothetical protein
MRGHALWTLPATLCLVLGVAAPARAEDPATILKAMSAYLAGEKSLAATFDSDIEVITTGLQKIQFSSTGEFRLRRPDRLFIARRGGYADLQLLYDGKTVTLLERDRQVAAKAPAPASVDAMLDELRDRLGVDAPGADFLLSNVGEVLAEDVMEAVYVGRGVVDGAECEHLAFRNADVDWQIWIEVGDRPVPRKYVITTKAVTGAPQYTLRFSNWSTAVADDALSSLNLGAAKMIDLAAMGEIDEVPTGVVREKKQ